jgi:hypothetical protein
MRAAPPRRASPAIKIPNSTAGAGVRGRARVADRAALPIGAGLGRGDRSRMKDTSRIYRDRT